MKKLLWPLILFSLGLNVVLAWGVATRRPSPTSAAVMAAPNPRPAQNTDDSRGFWASLHPEEPAALVGRLRAAGFPSDVVRAIVRTQVTEEFQERRKALDPEAATRPFWKRNLPDAKLMAAQRQLARDQEARLKELLGPEADSSDAMADFQRTRRFGELPPEKITEVEKIQRDFSEKQSDLFATGGGIISASSAIGEKLMGLQRQQRDALAKILTPAELEGYDIRNSSAGMNVRMRTIGLDLTEQEFRTLFQLQYGLERQYSMSGPTPPSPDVMRQRNESEQQMNEQIKSLLGPARYTDYERSAQPDYRNTSLLVARLELPPQTTQQIWTLREDFMQRATAVRSSGSLPPDQRAQQLAALQQEAAQAITPLVGGPRGFEAYQQYGGSWLQRINPPPPRAGAPGAATPLDGGGIIIR